ncbi:hypothetical protein N657DRAFT_166725 [Parathielavia appendiculata]|uniref:Uncharacterized protein n=1 Tax=Parathielavia appendiculata TaxID=2587402 RepID=A0AAN6Z067_9PEZI|nr:hypothetical protein N657DRAFT_166725 [Parathielavia appendiculata]
MMPGFRDGTNDRLPSSLHLSHDQFESLWPYCPIRLSKPNQDASGTRKSCQTKHKAISHVIQHLTREHGIIRSAPHHNVGETTGKEAGQSASKGADQRKYLVQCAWYDGTSAPDTASKCRKCNRIADWSDEELDEYRQEHSGPALCVRCYQVFHTRTALRAHLRESDLCPNRGPRLGKPNKAGILYQAFVSADAAPTWRPPSGSEGASAYFQVQAVRDTRIPSVPASTFTSTPSKTAWNSTPSWSAVSTAASAQSIVPTPSCPPATQNNSARVIGACWPGWPAQEESVDDMLTDNFSPGRMQHGFGDMESTALVPDIAGEVDRDLIGPDFTWQEQTIQPIDTETAPVDWVTTDPAWMYWTISLPSSGPDPPLMNLSA